MKMATISRPRMSFTQNHEWIDFNGTVGFVGVSAHRLKGAGKITGIRWHKQQGTVEKGILVAEIQTTGGDIPVHAPVCCQFLGQNRQLAGNLELILESPQDRGWLFFVTPLKFRQQAPLLTPEGYQQHIKPVTAAR